MAIEIGVYTPYYWYVKLVKETFFLLEKSTTREVVA